MNQLELEEQIHDYEQRIARNRQKIFLLERKNQIHNRRVQVLKHHLSGLGKTHSNQGVQS